MLAARRRLVSLLPVAALGLVAATLFLIRLTGAPDLMDNEYRLGATVLNAVQGGNWICPHDSIGNTDKPPLLTWLSALVSLPTGRVTRFTLYLPTALATLALSGLVFSTGRRHFGLAAGFLGALAYLLSDVGAKQMGTARWDGLFALTVALTALAAFRAWTQSRGWTWFWLAAALATLAKGPLGVLLGGLGLGACVWERRAGTPKALRGPQLAGIGLFLGMTLGWFLLAYRHVGPHLVANMIGSELVGHVIEHEPGRRFFKPVLNFLANFGPWSLLACLGLVRVCTAPASDETERRFERFLFCWCVGGLLLFSLSPHNPARLLWPVVPPAAILAGRELARLTAGVKRSTTAGLCVVATVGACAFFVLEYHSLARRTRDVQETLAVEELAGTVRRTVGDEFPLAHVDSPFALQLLLNTMRPAVSFKQAATLLRGERPAFVVVADIDRLERLVDPAALHELGRGSIAGKPYVRIVSNHPVLEWTKEMVTFVGPVSVRMDGVYLDRVREREWTFTHGGERSSLTLVNESRAGASIRLRIGNGEERERTLGPGDSWRLDVGSEPNPPGPG